MKKSLFSSLFTATFLLTGVATVTFLSSAPAQARVRRTSSTSTTSVKKTSKTPVTTTVANTTKDVSAFCQTSDAKIGSVIATACKGPMDGNDTGSGTPLLTSLNAGLFSDFVSSSYTWAMAGKSDESDSFGFEADNGSSAGSWLLNKALPSSTFVLSLKTSTAYSAYLFTNIDFSVTGLKGVFDTIGVALDGSGKVGKALSHASIFYVTNQTPAPQPPVEQPPVEQPPVEQPPVEQPPVEQPPVEQPPVEQPPVEQPPVEQPPVEQPPVEQPPVEQPPAPQPPAEQPPVEQPQKPVEPAKVPEPGAIAALMMMGGISALRSRRKN